jgi:transcriptional regulator with XRE-family HTH domain
MSPSSKAYLRARSNGPGPRCFAQAFGIALRHYRLKADLTEQQLAVQAGLEQRAICEIEQGRVSPNLRELVALAAVAEGCMVSLATILREADKIFLRKAARNLH